MAKNVEIKIDVDSGEVDIASKSALNFKQQIKLLKNELALLSGQGKEGTKEFQLLSAKLNEVKDSAERVDARSRELFSTLSLLPGPMGEFGREVDGSIGLLKTFSQFKLSDLSGQLKELGKDLLDVLKNLFGLNVAQKAVVESEIEAAAATEVNTTALEAETVATEAAEVATISLGTALKAIGIGFLIAGLAILVTYWDKISDAITGATDVTRAFEEANSEVTKQEIEFSKSLFDVKNALKAAKEGTMSKKDALKEYNDKLGKTIGFAGSLQQAEELMASNTKVVIESIKLRAQAQVLYGKSAEASAKLISGEGLEPTFWEKTWNIIKNVGNPLGMASDNVETFSDNIKTTQKNVDKFANAADDLTNKAIENDKKLKKGLAEAPKEPEKKENQNKQLIEKEKELQSQLTAIQTIGEKERAEADLKSQYEKEKREIEQLNISKDKEGVRQKALLELKQVYEKKVIDSNKKFDDQKLKDADAFWVKVHEQELKGIKDQYEQSVKTRQDKLTKDLQDLEEDKTFIALSYEEQQAVRTTYINASNNDIKVLKDKHNEEIKEKERQASKDLLDLYVARDKVLTKLTPEYYQNKINIIEETAKQERDNVNKHYDDLVTLAGTNSDKIVEINKQRKDRIAVIDQEEADNKKKIGELELNDYLETGSKLLGAVNSIYAMQNETNSLAMQNELAKVKGNAEEEDKIKRKYFEKNKKNQIAQAWIGTFQGAIQAYQSLAAIPIVGVGLGIAAAAAVLLFGKGKVDQISAQQYDGGAEGAGSSPAANSAQSLGKNYASGGMISGRRHAQGGTMIEAEAGEAIMTRGAVTAFSPLLSMMNQMGGGTSFSQGAVGQSGFDNPKTSNPISEPQIIKTYVVENELTTLQHKQARLKDLSTL